MELRTVKVEGANFDVYYFNQWDYLTIVSIESETGTDNIKDLLSVEALQKFESALRLKLMKPMSEKIFYERHPHGTYGGYLVRFKEMATPHESTGFVFCNDSFVRLADENRARGWSND